MYKALKTAQGEIQETLLKFADNLEVLGKKPSDETYCVPVAVAAPVAAPVPVPVPVPVAVAAPVPVPVAAPVPVPVPVAVAAPVPVPVDDGRMDRIEQALQFLHQKQNSQYGTLLESIQNLNLNLSKVVAILSEQAKEVIETATTIPNIQPMAQCSDLKTVCISDVSQAVDLDKGDTQQHGFDSPAYDEDEQSAIEAEQGDVDVEEDVPELEEDEEVVPEEDEEVVPEEDEGIEVEEWVYKGRKFFKDTENTVYANNDGEIGDPIGVYDPVKNIVKKLPPA